MTPTSSSPKLPRAKFPSIVLHRERGFQLSRLIEKGITVPADNGEKVTLPIVQVSQPFAARNNTGWEAVRVAVLGERVVSTLLYEAHEGGRVSGFLRLKRGRV